MTAPDGGTASEPGGGADADVLFDELLAAMTSVRRGTLDVRLARRGGVAGQVVDGFNSMVDLLERRNRDLLRISRVVGREGRILERMDSDQFDGAWSNGRGGGQLADRRPRAADVGDRARDRGGGRG